MDVGCPRHGKHACQCAPTSSPGTDVPSRVDTKHSIPLRRSPIASCSPSSCSIASPSLCRSRQSTPPWPAPKLELPLLLLALLCPSPPLAAPGRAATTHAYRRSRYYPAHRPRRQRPPHRASTAARRLPCCGRAWPGHRGPPLASPSAPTGANGHVGARAALSLGPSPPGLACRRWPRPQPPASVAKRPRATSAHAASACRRASQP
jgi:hypothetical protein